MGVACYRPSSVAEVVAGTSFIRENPGLEVNPCCAICRSCRVLATELCSVIDNAGWNGACLTACLALENSQRVYPWKTRSVYPWRTSPFHPFSASFGLMYCFRPIWSCYFSGPLVVLFFRPIWSCYFSGPFGHATLFQLVIVSRCVPK